MNDVLVFISTQWCLAVCVWCVCRGICTINLVCAWYGHLVSKVRNYSMGRHKVILMGKVPCVQELCPGALASRKLVCHEPHRDGHAKGSETTPKGCLSHKSQRTDQPAIGQFGRQELDTEAVIGRMR